MFLSFAFRDNREQQLISSRTIANYLYRYGVDLASQCQTATLRAMLTSSFIDDLPEGYPQLKMNLKKRQLAEMDCINDFVSQSDSPVSTGDWAVVLRPAQGYVSLSRLEHLCSQAAALSQDKNHKDKLNCLNSTIYHNSLSNPVWNMRAAPTRCLCNDAIRIPFDIDTMRDELELACPELWDQLPKVEISGSQDLPLFTYSDNALFAFQIGNVQNETLEAYNCTQCTYSGQDEKPPLFYGLPTFSLNENQPIDVPSLERLLKYDG